MQRPAITDAVTRSPNDEDVDEEVIRERVREQIEEIAAVAQHADDQGDVVGAQLRLVPDLRRLRGRRRGARAGARGGQVHSVVLIPSHKSHIDYLVLSYILFNYGMIPPLIAAGVNLSFWPLGPIFRRAGAFFLRRTFRGEKLYPIVFREYLVRQLEEGWPVEFFIEGTRSRTGKLVKPKYGMMDMVVRALASGRIDSIKVVPISVSYEKIIEEGAIGARCSAPRRSARA